MISCCSVDGHGEIKGWNGKAETVIWDKIKAERSSSSTAVGWDKTTDATMALCRVKDEKERRRVWEEMNVEVPTSAADTGGSGSGSKQQ